MISNDFEYDLQKENFPPLPGKKSTRKMKHISRLSGTTMAVIKLVHRDSASTSTFTQNDTMVPFVIYSLNKKDRWQLSDKMSTHVLEDLQEPGSNIVVIERQFSGLRGALETKYVQTYDMYLRMSKVKSVYQLNPEFSKQTSRGIGRKNVEVDVAPDVSINVFHQPSNYAKLYANKVESPCPFKHRFQSRNYTKLLKDEIQDLGDVENLESHEEEVDEIVEKPQKYYDLMDHFVAKPMRKKDSQYYGFVIVQE